jgi:hypothetical protein
MTENTEHTPSTDAPNNQGVPSATTAQTDEGSNTGATGNSVAPPVVSTEGFNETGYDPKNREVTAVTEEGLITISKELQIKTFEISELEEAKAYFEFLVSCSQNQ